MIFTNLRKHKYLCSYAVHVATLKPGKGNIKPFDDKVKFSNLLIEREKL